jgi:hypothetical protein
MIKNGFVMGMALGCALLVATPTGARGQSARLAEELRGPFDLGGDWSPGVQYFKEETQYVHLGFDGKRTGTETYVLKLKCVPAAFSGKDGDKYTCAAFEYRVNDGESLSVPALAGWSYVSTVEAQTSDSGATLFGIPHSRFEGLTNSRGTKLPPAISYSIYNCFIDFHSFHDVFARPSDSGKSIRDLRSVGQKIVHYSAFSEPPINLGAGFKEGSVFRNGEVSLEFKGLSLVDGAACALVGYDSGESTLKMIMAAGPDKDMVINGGSQYKGDLTIDLASRWLRKATMDEFVVTQVRLPGPAPAVPSYTVRHLLLRLVGRQEFEGN